MQNNDLKKGGKKMPEYRMYLVRRRLEIKMSVNKLCKLTETHRQQYYRLESGKSGSKVTMMYFAKIVLALGFQLEDAYLLEKQYLDSLEIKYGEEY